MLKKLLMAAGLAAVFSLSASIAEAKLNVTVGIGQPGGYCYYNHDPFRCGNYGYYPRPGYFVTHAGYDHDFDYGFGVSCKEARWIIIELGYRDVRTADCGSRYHTFIARKRGVVFRIKVYARNGRIQSIRAI